MRVLAVGVTRTISRSCGGTLARFVLEVTTS
jgi:hypothetical protein